jgi:apolipoprotein N-acyltransferase
VSVANTGPSQLIDPAGRVERSLPAGVPATGLVTVPALGGLTPYGRWGELPLLGLGLAAGGWRMIKKRNASCRNGASPCSDGGTR